MSIAVPTELALHHGGKDFLNGGLKFAETFELWGGLRAGDTVLDIGCGPGRMAIGIGERFGWNTDYTGFDVKKADIDFASAAISGPHPSFRFVHFDVRNSHYNKTGALTTADVRFPADDRSIDFVFATSIYTHFYVQDIAHYLAETARTCRRRSLSTWFLIDGRFEAAKARGSARFTFPHRAEDGTLFENPRSPLDAVAHDLASVEALHAAAGLRIVAIHPGEWTGRGSGAGRHSQDVVVSEPA